MRIRSAHHDRQRQRGGRPAGGFDADVRSHAFSLLEVIIASAIFFMFAFAVLSLVTQGLVSARSLQDREPDPGIILSALSLTNAFEEGSMSGDYEDIAPGMYPGYRWEAYISEVGSNGLFQVDVMTYSQNHKKKGGVVTIGAQFFRPQSKPGSATKGRL